MVVAAQGGLLHWGVCAQDQNKCGTCGVGKCACSQGTLWNFQACLSRMCMRCYQFDDGTFESQVAPLTMSPTCPGAAADQAVVCANAAFKAIYSYGPQCIDLNVGSSLNCIEATRSAAGRPPAGSPSSPDPASDAPSTEPVVVAGGLSLGLIVGVAVGAAVLLAAAIVVATVAVRRRRQAALGAVAKSERELLSPPKPKNPSLSRTTSPTQTVASPRRGRSVVQQSILEQAVNDLV